ncbi:MAG: hypothetical protein IKN55_10035 [Oscillospiraceae bacterium]|nr:hypothetical protein [Oscillospiraceae bacterium]
MDKKKKFPLLTAGIILLIVSAVVYVPMLFWALFLFRDMSQHVGIIGGADAPTAEFLFRRLFSEPGFWITLAGGFLSTTGLTAGVLMTFAGVLERIGKPKAP